MEIIPLCFCSTKSQMILLLKYGIGSHWQRKNGRTNLQEDLFFGNFWSYLEPGSNPTKGKFNYTVKGLQNETYSLINTILYFPRELM